MNHNFGDVHYLNVTLFIIRSSVCILPHFDSDMGLDCPYEHMTGNDIGELHHESVQIAHTPLPTSTTFKRKCYVTAERRHRQSSG